MCKDDVYVCLFILFVVIGQDRVGYGMLINQKVTLIVCEIRDLSYFINEL